MTDVHLATELMHDAYTNSFDSALIITADGDLEPVSSYAYSFNDLPAYM